MSNTPNAGSPDRPSDSSSSRPQPAPLSRRGLLPLILAVVAVSLAIFVGTQVVGIFYSILFPPMPPTQDDFVELEYTNEAHGVDSWQYATAQDACSLTRYYEAQGGACVYAPDRCEEGFIDAASVFPGDNVARCTGEMQFSIFALKWEATIATGYRDDNPTRFKLSREVFWTGEVPPPMFSEE